MSSLRPCLTLARRDIRQQPGRHLLAAAGVALAVAIVLVAIGSQSSLTAAVTSAERAAVGDADIVATPLGDPDVRLTPEALAALARLPEVRAAYGSIGFRVRLAAAEAPATTGAEASNLLFARQDLVGAPPPSYLDRILRGTDRRAANDVLLTEEKAAELGVDVGDAVRLAARNDVRGTVAGIIALDEADRASERPAVITGPELAGQLDDGRARPRAVHLQLHEGADARTWLRTHGAAAPATVTLQRADELVGQLRSITDAMTSGLRMLAAATALMGCMLCYHVNQIAAVAARRNVGLLRAVGAGRRDVLAVSALTSGVTSLMGVAAGIVGGSWLTGVVSPLLSRVMRMAPAATTLPPAAYVVAVAVALGLSIVAMLASRSWRVGPLEALVAIDEPTPHRAVPLIASIVLTVAAAFVVLNGEASRSLLSMAGVTLAGASAWTARNLLVWWASRAPRHRTSNAGPLRVLGTRSIARDAGLVGVSVGIIMATFAVLLATAMAHLTVDTAIARQVERQAGGDVQIFGDPILPADFAERAGRIPEVEALTRTGFGMAQLPASGNGDAAPGDDGERGVAVPLRALDPAEYFALSDLVWIPGDEGSGPSLAEPDTIALPLSVAERLGVDDRRQVTMVGPHGPVELRIVGFFRSGINSLSVINRQVAAERFAITEDTMAHLIVQPGQSERVRQQLLAEFPGLRVTTTDWLQETTRRDVFRMFGIGYSSLLLGALLCTIGLGASMSASVIRREREFRLLRSVGTSRRQVVRMLLFETATMVALGLAAALPLGWAFSKVVLALFLDIVGRNATPTVPIAFLVLFPLALVPLALSATLLPARRATRIALVP